MTRQKYKSHPVTLEEAFLCDIVENPDDDTPRLVYADWLSENGQAERAEFIQIQCRLAAYCCLPHTETGPLNARAMELEREHREAWLADLGLGGLIDGPVSFERGFVEGMTSTADRFLKYGSIITARTPIREVALTGAAGRVGELAACPRMCKIISLNLGRNDLGPRDAAALASSDVLSNLTQIRLFDNHIGDDGAVAVANSTTLTELYCLELGVERHP